MAQAPNTIELDEHLKVVISALHGAVNRAVPHMDDTKVVGQAINDCREVLDEVMAGKVSDWVA